MTSRQQSFRVAACCAQDLVVTARAIEARVSGLTPETPDAIIEETIALVRATALQVAGTVHDLIAATVCLTSCVPESPDDTSVGDAARR